MLTGIRPTSYLIGDGTGHGDPQAEFLRLKHVNIAVIFWLIHPIMSS